jgi:hypothetical protein
MIMDVQGYNDAVAAVMEMNMEELLKYLDGLYGRDTLSRSVTLEDIRNEALAQTERLYGPDYERYRLNQKMAFRTVLMPQRKEDDDA